MNFSIGKRLSGFLKTRFIRIFQSIKNIFSYNADISPDEINKEGVVCLYYDSGKLKSLSQYDDKKLNGVSCTYYESGQVKSREFYKEDQLEGLSKSYYETGKTQTEEMYFKGILISKISYNESGKIILKEKYHNI